MSKPNRGRKARQGKVKGIGGGGGGGREEEEEVGGEPSQPAGKPVRLVRQAARRRYPGGGLGLGYIDTHVKDKK